MVAVSAQQIAGLPGLLIVLGLLLMLTAWSLDN